MKVFEKKLFGAKDQKCERCVLVNGKNFQVLIALFVSLAWYKSMCTEILFLISVFLGYLSNLRFEFWWKLSKHSILYIPTKAVKIFIYFHNGCTSVLVYLGEITSLTDYWQNAFSAKSERKVQLYKHFVENHFSQGESLFFCKTRCYL